MTMPWPVSWLIVGLSVTAAYLLAILWHEAGHAATAYCLGIRVYAWGIGSRKPWFSMRLGKTSVYLAILSAVASTQNGERSDWRIVAAWLLSILSAGLMVASLISGL